MRLLLLLGFFLGTLQAFGAWDSDLALPPPAPVVDEFHLLSNGEFSQLDQLVRRIKTTSGVEITVFIPATLQGRQIEDFSIAVAEKWKLGRKKEDRGLLLVVAPKERQMRFEVGSGLEGDVTDVFSRRILDDTMRPLFKQGRYYDGIVAALARIQEKVPLGLQPSEIGGAGAAGNSDSFRLFMLLLVVVFLLHLLSRFGGGGRGGYRGGGYVGGFGGGGGGGGDIGGGGGGSWGGGGGGFSGGGSSSSW
ncbi:MAG: TPM domain-containing protein [Bdellovibrionota bacterium]